MNAKTTETAVLAGGCFWCLEAVFEQIEGVESVVSGYAGGRRANPTYEQVSSGATGHAEVIQVAYDPAKLTYREVLEIFFAFHDPTTPDRQGHDVGTQYRSAIFYADPQQQRVAEAYVAQLEKARTFRRPIVTRVDPLKGFYPAEAYHQDFLIRNPSYPYIVINDLPKIANLKRLFPEQYRDKPVLARAAS